jgi:AraC-like DNA-binding protein
MNHIPIHRLEASNFEINKIEQGTSDLSYYTSSGEHRDDYYIFIYQECGKARLTVDFQDITLSGNSVLCIQPGQVHFGNLEPDTVAWIIQVASEWVPTAFRLFLMETTTSHRPVGINGAEAPLFRDALHLLRTFEEQRAAYSDALLKSMFDVCLYLFMQVFQQAIDDHSKNNLRPTLITRQFRSLLLSNFRMMKSPAAYASSLNITPVYLNEVVKDTTGYTVSHWIHQEIISEAKRTLFYTNNPVKEIAYDLGYSDPAYFIRLFKKITGISPLQFRHKYRK